MPMRIRQHKWDPRKSLTRVKIKDFEIENNSRYKIRSLSAVSRSLGFCTLNIVKQEFGYQSTTGEIHCFMIFMI